MILEALEKLNPCEEGLLYAKQFFSLQDAWNNCTNPHWMWWFLVKMNKAEKVLIAYSDACIEYMNMVKLENNAPNNYNVEYAIDANCDVHNNPVIIGYLNHTSIYTIAATAAIVSNANLIYRKSNDYNTQYAIYRVAHTFSMKQHANILRSLVTNPFNT